MKEDIIILENAIKYSQKQFEEIGEYTYLDKDKMQAIENLIKRNKELEEENKILRDKRFNENLEKTSKRFHKYLDQHFKEVFIPKSIIKEKIEELLRCVSMASLNDNINVSEIESQVEVLEELLKE
jgi:hypothetical protein